MFLQRISALAAAALTIPGFVAGPAAALIGPRVCALGSYRSGYQVQNSAGLHSCTATFTVPDAPADAQAGLTGGSMTALMIGRQAACGWFGIGTVSGVIGCYDEVDTGTGWVTSLTAILPGAVVTEVMHYALAESMKQGILDVNTGAIATTYFTGPLGEKWSQVDIDTIPSITFPGKPLTLLSFSSVRLTPP